MNRRAVPCVLLLLLAASWLLAACGSKPGSVEGVVTDTSGQPLPGVQVVAYELRKAREVTGLDVFQKGVIVQKQAADGNGRFVLPLERGDYLIQVWVEGLEVAERKVEVRSGRATQVDFQIESPSS